MADASRFVLPASPNWYCSSVADCSLSGKYAFGARNCVYLLDVRLETPEFAGQLVGHSERVSAVCFSKHRLHANFLASGSDDRAVKIWDIETKLALLEHKAHSAKVTALTWSALVTDLVVSGDEKGQIIAWRYAEASVVSACPIQEHIFCLAFSCLSEGDLAVGYKSGVILVLLIGGDGSISTVHRLRGHSGEIHSLAWCPTPKEHIDFGPLQEKTAAAEGCLLVSGSRDQTVRLWDSLHGKVLSILQMPKRGSQKWRDRYDGYGIKDRMWLSVCWPVASPGHVISSTHGGELLLWDLSKEGKEQHQCFGLGHSRIVFNISCDVEGTKIITVSMDRQIIVWDPEFLRSLHTLPTLGGFAYSLAISPLDPGTVGVGVGDNMVRIWQTTSAMGPYETVTLWQGIKSKVMVVQWHPKKEGVLAFGADDGQVGVYNVLSKKVDTSATYHKRTVYSLSWGPPCPSLGSPAADSTTMRLYSCGGDGSVFAHDPGHFMDDAIDVNSLILKTNQLKPKMPQVSVEVSYLSGKHKPFGRADVSWSPDGTVLALGNEDGSIELYVPPDLNQVCSIITHKKSITTLAWHHGYKELDLAENISCKYWLASGSNESTIYVHDLNGVLQKATGESSSAVLQVTPLTNSFRQLLGHSGRVTGLCWSPHQSELLLSSSYDGTAQVWDVVKGEPLHNFRGHSSRVMCVVWGYLDPDLVYSGGEDGTVRPWRPSLQQCRQPPVPDKKIVQNQSKSSKNKRSRHKAKGKEDYANEKELRRQQGEKKDELNEGAKFEATENLGDLPHQVAESNPLLTTDICPEQGSTASEKEEEAKCQDVNITKKTVELDSNESDKERKITEVKEPYVEDTMSEAVVDDKPEQGMDALFQSESRVHAPLRSRVSLETVSSKKKKKVKSMFPVSAVADNRSKAVTQEECVTLANILYGQGSGSCQGNVPWSDESVNFGLFGDRRSTYKMFSKEGQHHKENGNHDYRLQLEIWKGNLGGALQVATNSGQLCDWLVALSPLAGYDVWMKTTRAFANQLLSQGAYHRAVLYYLACHDIYNAIDVFRKQAMYREAIALAKVRLSPLDPVLFDLYSTWARKLESENSFEQAAKCYLAVHSSSEAVRVLFRRGDESSLRTAFQVALLCGETELAGSIALRLTHCFLMTSNWKEALAILMKCPGLEAHILNLCVHELFLVSLCEAGKIDQDMCKDDFRTEISSTLDNDASTSELFARCSDVSFPYPNSPWLLNCQTNKWFVVCILESWLKYGAFTSQYPQSTDLYQSLKSYYESISTGSDTIAEVLTKISYEITLGLLSSLVGDLYRTGQYWLQALSQCSKCCLFDLQRQLCALLLPRGVESLANLLSFRQELRVEQAYVEPVPHLSTGELFRHFYAYYCQALLIEIWYRHRNVMELFSAFGGVPENSARYKQKTLDASIEDSSSDVLPSSPENSSVFRRVTDGSSRSDIGESLNEVDRNEASNCVGVERVCLLRNSSDSEPKWRLQFVSVLLNSAIVLLSHERVKISSLREILTEIRKAIVVKRTKQLMQGKSPGSHPTQEKKSKVNPKVTASKGPQTTGTCAGSTLVDGSSEGVAPEDCTTTEMKHADAEAKSGDCAHEEEGTDMKKEGDDADKLNGFDGSTKGEGEKTSRHESNVDREDLKQERPYFKPLTLQGNVPVELRYLKDEVALGFLEMEESRILKELKQFVLKDLSFPSPLESALILGRICLCPEGLPAEKHELYQLGYNVVQWALRSAQTSTDIKGLRRLVSILNKTTTS